MADFLLTFRYFLFASAHLPICPFSFIPWEMQIDWYIIFERYILLFTVVFQQCDTLINKLRAPIIIVFVFDLTR